MSGNPRGQRSRRTWIVLVVVVGAIGAVCATAVFGPTAYRSWKQERLVHQAHQFIKENDITNAVICLRKALMSNPSSLGASRLMAELAEQARSREAIRWRSRIVDLQPTNFQSRLAWADTALLLGDLNTAEEAFSSLNKSGERDAAFYNTAGTLALARKEHAAAEAHFAEACRLDPTNVTAQLNLAAVRLQATNETVYAWAQQEMKRLASFPAVNRQALRYLVTDAMSRNANEAALGYCRELMARPQPEFPDRLLELTALRQAKDARLETRLAELQREATAQPKHIFALGEWMLNSGRGQEVAIWVKSLSPGQLATLPVPFIAFDCFVTLRDWPSAEALLDSQNWETMEYLRLALRSGVHRERKETAVARTTWLRALKAADGYLDRLVHLARSAGSWGWTEETEEVMKMIVQQFPSEKWAMQSLSKWFHSSGKTVALRNLLMRAAEEDPANLQAKSILALTSLLLDGHDTKMHSLAREVYEKRPEDGFFASVCAYSLCLQQKIPEALKILEKLTPAQLQEPTVATYYGIILCEAGKRSEAQRYLELAERARLLPEEKELLKKAKARS